MKNLMTLLAALAVAALSTSTVLAAGPACEPSESAEDCVARLQVVLTGLSQVNASLEAEAATLRTAQSSAASRGDGVEVARLQQELATVTAERDRLKDELDAANRRITELEGTVESLETRMAGLERQMTTFLEAEAARPVASSEAYPEESGWSRTLPEEPVPAPGPRVEAPVAELAAYRPQLDPTVYGRMGTCDFSITVPDPVSRPDTTRAAARNDSSFENVTDGYVYLRVRGVDVWSGSSGITVAGEVLVPPGGFCEFPVEGSSTRITMTNAWVSTSRSSRYDWNDRERRPVSLDRAGSSCTTDVPRNARYEYGSFSCMKW